MAVFSFPVPSVCWLACVSSPISIILSFFLYCHGLGASSDRNRQVYYVLLVCRPLPAALLVVRCMNNGRGARTDAFGRSFAVLSTKVSTVDLRLRLVVPRTMPAAVASRCCRRNKDVSRICNQTFTVVDAGFSSWLASRVTYGRMLEVSRDAITAGEEQLAWTPPL